MANSILTTMSVAHIDDDTHNNPGETSHVENAFPNGDVYMGLWATSNFPHGQGKYFWADAYTYIGDWQRGKMMGIGKFIWPCGATYEGQFKNGYMDGEGVYIGSSRDIYRGTWVYDMKHGKGSQKYASGDHYEGNWRAGKHDGKGRYKWENGNQYIGYWRQGAMNGHGALMWANGDRYDGSWENGLPGGNGTFRSANGSFYISVWGKDQREQSGTYYPSGSQSSGSFYWDPQELYLEKLSGCRISGCEDISVFPSQKAMNWPSSQGGEDLKKRSNCVENDATSRRASEDACSSGSESDFSFDGSGDCLEAGTKLDERMMN